MLGPDELDYIDGKTDAVRNENGIWINSNAFRETALAFKKQGYYCEYPEGTPGFMDFWKEEKTRTVRGHKIGGAMITGEHYNYLNFCPIMMIDEYLDASKNKAATNTKKVRTFPHFWDGDYNYFWVRAIAKKGLLRAMNIPVEERDRIHALPKEEMEAEYKRLYDSLFLMVDMNMEDLQGGCNLIVGKSRRKGYSYKSASIGANNFFTKPESVSIFNAYEKKYLYPGGIFTMTKNYINFINENTAFATPSDEINKADHIKSSYISYKNGLPIVKGYKSELMAYTCKDNPDANRGKDAEDIWVEESGAFGTPGLLKNLYAASQDCVKAGAFKTGLITIFGTSGDMEGGTYDYADMMLRPKAFDMLSFYNIWDEGMRSNLTGFFHPYQWNVEGYYDEQGNSDVESAIALEKKARKLLEANGGSSVEISQRKQERPLGPTEAFSSISKNNFPTEELEKVKMYLKQDDRYKKLGTPCNLVEEDGKIVAKPILDGSRTPIYSIENLPSDLRGCPIIYEDYIPGLVAGTYKIGYDPIRQEHGTSLASIIVYKSNIGVTEGGVRDNIVAEYIGRFDDPDDIDELALKFARMYNTQVMYENEITGTKTYFRNQRALKWLAAQPDDVIKANIKKSKVQRVYGCHMNDQLKDAGERYTKSWLLRVLDYDEKGNKIRILDKIPSLRLIEELIRYSRKGNFDMVSALFMVMMQEQQLYLRPYSSPEEETRKQKLGRSIKEVMGNS